MHTDPAAQRTVFTHCLICEQLCGLEVAVADGRISSIRPDKQNPYTWRDFCVKGQQAHEVAASPWRVNAPMKRVGDRFVATSYDEAGDDIADRLQAIIARHGRDAVAGYLGNPMGFSFSGSAWHFGFLGAIGTNQKYGVQSIDSNAKHVACDAMFGLETLALLPDIDATDYALLIGTNPAVSKFNWGGKVPNGWRRLKDRTRDGATIVVLDPRRTETAAGATRHIAPVPETDWAFLLGVVKVMLDEGLERLPPDIGVTGLAGLRGLCATVTLDRLAASCDVPVEDITTVARGFAAAPRAFAFAGTGPALGRHGVLTHWLTLALNVLTDRLDRPGGRFAPNWPYNMALAKGGGEPKRHSRVRGIETVVGQHSLSELADEILTPGDGQVRALILGGGNPVSTGAGGDHLARALGTLDLLVSVDLFQRESHREAHWLIPAVHFLEREEVHVGLHTYNDQPFIQSTRQVLPPPEGVRPEWTFYRDLAAAMGLELFGGQARAPDDLAAAMLAGSGQVTLEQVRAQPHGLVFGERTMGHFRSFMQDRGRAIELCPARFAEALEQAVAEGVTAVPTGQYRIISRRRNGMMNASLAETAGSVGHDETAETVELNAHDAAAMGVAVGDRLDLVSATATIRVRAVLTDAIRRGTIVLAQGWGSPLFDPTTSAEVFRRGNARNKLVSDTDIDPLSAAPRLNGTLVTIVRVADAARDSDDAVTPQDATSDRRVSA
ncbi:molybdopterin-containing oxidoreductase family protein [Sphingomonas solaris]|uniref:molybdopterin-containing oxidoreductase family protein n=1 Tax=Alterirhizorhabdus solaris TaxID=2529389 RepID=UPI001396A78D|nr:molybdopterin-dependent oxidoreductase [Sphingomonas solaris]